MSTLLLIDHFFFHLYIKSDKCMSCITMYNCIAKLYVVPPYILKEQMTELLIFSYLEHVSSINIVLYKYLNYLKSNNLSTMFIK